MNDPGTERGGYLLAALVGGVVGGLVATVIAKLIPKISGMLAEGG